jgi:hypothetical protein
LTKKAVIKRPAKRAIESKKYLVFLQNSKKIATVVCNLLENVTIQQAEKVRAIKKPLDDLRLKHIIQN